MTRLNFGAISNSEERLAGRAFLTFGFFSFLGFAAFAATGTASATLAALAAFACAFWVPSFHLIQLCQVVPYNRLTHVYISEICL